MAEVDFDPRPLTPESDALLLSQPLGSEALLIITLFTLRERLHTHKVFTKDQFFYLNYHKFSIKSYVLDVY